MNALLGMDRYIDRVRLNHQTKKHKSSNVHVFTKVPYCMEATYIRAKVPNSNNVWKNTLTFLDRTRL